jgi:2-hydroxychromene-2-carboxylate isomerase
VLFAAMLKHHGQLGPAEIAPKRDWTCRQALWHAHSKGIEMKMPASHPFNPLPLLRLASACGTPAGPASLNRYACETILRHVWQGGAEAADEERLAALTAQLAPQQRLNADEAKAQLKKNTDEAIALNVFGVPAMHVGDKIFWGFDALPMLREYLLGNSWFEGEGWNSVSQVAVGITRKA